MRNITLVLFLVSVYPSLCQVPGHQLFDDSKIHEIKFTSFYEDLTDTLTKNYVMSFGLGQIQLRKIPYAPASVTIDGTVLDSIGIRFKGFNSWWNSIKKPIKVDLNKYKDHEYDGLSKFNLHNGSGDPSFIRENISYNILRSLGIKAPRTAFAKVFVDDTYLGLYRIVEQVDNTFLDVNFGSHEGNLYVQQSKGSGGFDLGWVSNDQRDYYPYLELENHQKDNDWSSFIHFLNVLNSTPDEGFRDEILAVFDVDEYLQILAFDIAIGNLDFYGNSGRNYYLAEVDGIFHWVPWDYNLSWREGASPIDIFADDYPLLMQRILKVPEFYNSFMHKYCALLPYFSSTSFNTLVENEAASIKRLMEVDPYTDYSYEAFEANLETSWESIPGLKVFAAERYIDIINTFGSMHFDCTVTDISEEGIRELNVFPIPATDILQVALRSSNAMTVTILNSLGQVVVRTTLDETGSVDIRQLPSGFYVLKAWDGNKMYSRSVIVKR